MKGINGWKKCSKVKCLTAISLFAILTSGCQKQDEAERFYINNTYTIDNSIRVNPIRLFTRTGEINDTLVIHDFVRRNTIGIGFNSPFYMNMSIFPANITFRISFNSNDSATMTRTSAGLAPDTAIISINKKASFSATQYGLLLRDRDSVSWIFLTDYNYSLVKKSITYYPNRNCGPTIGGMEYCSFNPIIPLKISNDQLFLPITAFIVKSYYSVTSNWGFMNTFKEPDLSQLSNQDTLAVQTNEARLKKE